MTPKQRAMRSYQAIQNGWPKITHVQTVELITKEIEEAVKATDLQLGEAREEIRSLHGHTVSQSHGLLPCGCKWCRDTNEKRTPLCNMVCRTCGQAPCNCT